MNKKRLISVILSGVMLFASAGNIVFADGETTQTPLETTAPIYEAQNVSYRFDTYDTSTVKHSAEGVTAATESNVGPQVKLDGATASFTFKNLADLSGYDFIELQFAAQKTATITFEGSADGTTYTKVGEITTIGADNFNARAARTAITNTVKDMTYLKVSWNAQSTDQWYNYIKLINECDGMFDYSAYDYTGAAAGTTPITDIWTGWKTTDESAFVYQNWGGNTVCAAGKAGILTSPGYAKDTSGYKIEFTLGLNGNGQDTLVFDADGLYSFGYCYAPANNGFYPQDGERGDFAQYVKNHIKEELGTTTAKNGTSGGTLFTNDHSVMRIEVQNHNDELTVGDKTYNRYYTVKFTVDKAGDGQTFEHVATEYYAGAGKRLWRNKRRRNKQFPRIRKFKNTPIADTQNLADYEAYVFNARFGTLAEAAAYAAGCSETVDTDGKNGMQPKITLLTDVVMDDDYINAFPSGKDPYIDGNGHKFTIDRFYDKWAYYENMTIDTAGTYGFQISNYGRFNNIKIDGITNPVNNLILNDGYIRNSDINRFHGLAVVENSSASRYAEYMGYFVIENTQITNTIINHYNGIDAAVRVKTTASNPSVIKNSTITGTVPDEGNTNEVVDVRIAGNRLDVEGNTTIGTLAGASSDNLTFKNFTGDVTLVNITPEDGKKLAKIEGEFTDGSVKVKDLDANYKVTTEEITEGEGETATTVKYLVLKQNPKATTPSNITVTDYANEKLGGFESDVTYIITTGEGEAAKTEEVTLGETETAIDVTDYIGKTISIVRKGVRGETVDSDALQVTVPVRPTAPTVTGETATVYQGKGKLTGTTADMEYKSATGENAQWADCTVDMEVVPGSYIVRAKATASVFASAPTDTIVVGDYTMTTETIPNIGINYENENLTGFTAGAEYSVKVGDAKATVITPETTEIAIGADYFGKTLTIVKKARKNISNDSAGFELSVPARPNAPTGLTATAPTTAAAQGKITGTTADMQYKSTADGSEWNDCSSTETAVVAGEYIVRTKATDEKFASETIEVTVPAFEKSAWTTPDISIDYVGEKLTGFTENGSYTVKIGTDGEAQSVILTTDNKLDAAAYMGKTIYIVRIGDSDHTDSLEKTLEVPARPQITDTNIKIDNNKEGVTIPTGYFYGTQNSYDNITSEGANALVVVEPETAIYIYKPAVTGVSFKSEILSLTAPERNDICKPEINFTDETIGTTDAMQYSTDDGSTWTSCTATMNVTAFGWNGTAAKTVKFRVPANENNYASNVVSSEIKARPIAPNKDEDFTVSQPQEINGKGKLTGMDGTQYKLSTESEWIIADADEIEVETGTYNVRTVSTATDFASAVATVTVNQFVPSKKDAPILTVNYATEELEGFIVEESYKIGVSDVEITNGKLSLASYIGSEDRVLEIVTKGDNTKLDSDTTNVTIKARPAAPQVTGGKGKITGTTALMEYKKPDASNWTVCTDSETEVEAGEYNVRIAATDTDFAGVLVTVTVAAADIDPPVPQPVSIPAIGKYSGKVNISRLTNDKEIFTIEPDASIAQDFAITLYVAEYDNDGRLTSLKCDTAEKSADGKITIISDRPASSKFKFMLWDRGLCPLIEAIDNLN